MLQLPDGGSDSVGRYKLRELSSSEQSDPALLLIWFCSPLSLLQKISFNQFAETPWFVKHHSFCSQGWLYHVHSKYFNPIPSCHFLRVLAALFLLFPQGGGGGVGGRLSCPYFYLCLFIFLWLSKQFGFPLNHLKNSKTKTNKKKPQRKKKTNKKIAFLYSLTHMLH